jgi:hypothetical protein
MFLYYREGPIDRSTAVTERLAPGFTTLEQWAEENQQSL